MAALPSLSLSDRASDNGDAAPPPPAPHSEGRPDRRRVTILMEPCFPVCKCVVPTIRHCNRCRRTILWPNPLPNKCPGSECLVFPRDDLNRCIVCINFGRSIVRGISAKDFDKHLKVEVNFCTYFYQSLPPFQEVLDRTQGNLTTSATSLIPKPSICNLVHEEGSGLTYNGPVFWPKTMWDSEQPEHPDFAKERVTVADGGLGCVA